MIVAAAELFKAETGRYPSALEEMAPEAAARAGRNWSIRIEDAVNPWGQPYIYRLVDGKPHAICLGRDGRPGGEGEDEDREVAGPLSSSRSGKSQR
jgi:general secretion pathway protein G